MAKAANKEELLQRLLEQLRKELQMLISGDDNFCLTINANPSQRDASLEIKKTVKLN